VTTRRSHQCKRDGCDSEAVWKMFVRFMTRTPKGNFIPCLAETTIKVCDRHQKDAAEGFVSARNLDMLAEQFKRENLAMPGPGSIEIEFARIPKAEGVISVQAIREHFKRAG